MLSPNIDLKGRYEKRHAAAKDAKALSDISFPKR